MLYSSSATVCEFFKGFVVFQIRPGVISVFTGRGKLEVTSPFLSSTPFLYKWPADIFVYVFSFSFLSEVFYRFLFWREIAFGAEILGILGILTPKQANINETPKNAYLRQTASLGARYMLVRRSIRQVH
jgi:hypothetical protein